MRVFERVYNMWGWIQNAMDMSGIMTLVVVIMLIAGAIYAYGIWCKNRAIEDIRTGRFISDIEFRSRWASPFQSGFRDIHAPGVVIVVIPIKKDSIGRPREWSEAVVIATDDITRTCLDQLSGVIDGQAYDTGRAVVSVTRRMGDAMTYAQTMARYYETDTVLQVTKHTKKQYPVTKRSAYTAIDPEMERGLLQGL